jgi:excisionase family DNA binding protein
MAGVESLEGYAHERKRAEVLRRAATATRERARNLQRARGSRTASRDRDYLTREEVADRARVSLRTVERALASNELEHYGGNGYRVQVTPEQCDRWIEQRGRSAA